MEVYENMSFFTIYFFYFRIAPVSAHPAFDKVVFCCFLTFM